MLYKGKALEKTEEKINPLYAIPACIFIYAITLTIMSF